MYVYITNTHTHMIPMHICLTVFINLVSMCLLSPSSLPILTSPSYKFFHSFPPKQGLILLHTSLFQKPINNSQFNLLPF